MILHENPPKDWRLPTQEEGEAAYSELATFHRSRLFRHTTALKATLRKTKPYDTEAP